MQNLTFSSPSVTTSARYVGLITGESAGTSTISGITVNGGSVSNTYAASATNHTLDSFTGGIAGYYANGLVTNITSSLTVGGKSSTGGIIGATVAEPALTISIVVVSGNVSGLRSVGGLLGLKCCSGTTAGVVITDSSVTASSVSGLGQDVGGILGYAWNISITRTYSSASVSGKASGDGVGVSVGAGQGAFVGGIAGQIAGSDSTFEGVGSSGSVSADGTDGDTTATGVGGVIGWARMKNLYLTRVYHRGNVTGYDDVGGFAGTLSSAFRVVDSYSRSNLTITGTSTATYGGMMGSEPDSTRANQMTRTYYSGSQSGVTARYAIYRYSMTAVCTNFFFDREVMADNKTGGFGTICGGAGGIASKTTAAMKTEATFTNFDFTAGTGTWIIDPTINDGYPYLANVGGQVIPAPTVVLAASAPTSSSSTLTFTLTATSGQIDCGTVSTTDGVDFDFQNISSISMAQTSSTLCTITATSSFVADGASGVSGLAEAATFEVSYTGSLAQTNISSGSPATVTVSIPAATTTTTAASTTTTAATTTTVAASTTTTAASTTTVAATTTTTAASTTTTAASTTTTAASTSTVAPTTTSTTPQVTIGIQATTTTAAAATTTSLALAAAPARATTTTQAAVALDGDASASVEENLAIAGSSGIVLMYDGSTFAVNRNGAIGLKMRTAYIGSASGSVRATYKVAGKSRTWSCTIRTVKIGKINKNAKRSVGNWFPKKLYTVPNNCKMPAALMSSLSTQKVQLVGKVRFVKQWPTTGKTVNPLTKSKIPVGIRTLRVTLGR
ncbi:MAG: hypothetical protein ACKOCC_07705 [Actinomycetota bacterium]